METLALLLSIFVLLVVAVSAFPAPANPFNPFAHGTLGVEDTLISSVVPLQLCLFHTRLVDLNRGPRMKMLEISSKDIDLDRLVRFTSISEG